MDSLWPTDILHPDTEHRPLQLLMQQAAALDRASGGILEGVVSPDEYYEDGNRFVLSAVMKKMGYDPIPLLAISSRSPDGFPCNIEFLAYDTQAEVKWEWEDEQDGLAVDMDQLTRKLGELLKCAEMRDALGHLCDIVNIFIENDERLGERYVDVENRLERQRHNLESLKKKARVLKEEVERSKGRHIINQSLRVGTKKIRDDLEATYQQIEALERAMMSTGGEFFPDDEKDFDDLFAETEETVPDVPEEEDLSHESLEFFQKGDRFEWQGRKYEVVDVSNGQLAAWRESSGEPIPKNSPGVMQTPTGAVFSIDKKNAVRVKVLSYAEPEDNEPDDYGAENEWDGDAF